MKANTENKVVEVNAVVGTVLNIFLVLLIITDKQLNGNGYKRMLILIAFYHMSFSVVHCLVELNCTYDGNGFMCFSERLRHYGFWESFGGCVLYAFMCSQSLSLFAVHCTYRYVNITGNYSFIFARWYCVVLVGIVSFIFGAAYAVSIAILMKPTPERTSLSKTILATEYNMDIEGLGYGGTFFQFPDENGVMNYHMKHIIGSIICAIVIMTVYLTTCVVGFRLYFFVRDGIYTTASRSIHMQLLCILLAQGTAPLITELVPLSVMLTGGIFGILPPWTSVYWPILVSSYPAIDAVMIIILFKAYRERVLYYIRICVCFWSSHVDPSKEVTLKSVSVTRIIGQNRKQEVPEETTIR